MCSLDVAFASATVRNRSREGPMAVPMASFATVVTFGGFKRRVASFRVAGEALCDIPACSPQPPGSPTLKQHIQTI